MVKEQLTNYQGKFNFIDKQTKNIENVQDDITFTDLVKESNQTIQKLNEQIDLEAIETAKALEKERKLQTAEMNAELEDEEFDDDIEDEINKLEADMLSNNMQKFDASNKPVHNENLELSEQKNANQKQKKEMMLS